MVVETEIGIVEYSDIGEGQPILFLHGGHSNSKETLWHRGFDLEKFRLITPSRPGYGNTPLSNFESPKKAAKLVVSLLDEIGIEKIMVIGISAGGLTAIELASNHKGRVQKLVLLSAVTQKWLQPSDELYKKGMFLFSPMRQKISWALFRLSFRIVPKLMTKILFEQLSTLKADIFNQEEIDMVKKMTFNQSSGTGFINDLEQDIESDELSNIDCPTLILHSKNDQTVSMEMAHHAKKNISNATLKLYNNKWGHLLWIGADSTELIREVLEFIE